MRYFDRHTVALNTSSVNSNGPMRDFNYKFAFKQKLIQLPPETIFTSAFNVELKIVTGIHQLYAASENP